MNPYLRLCLSVATTWAVNAGSAEKATSQWVHSGPDGNLIYQSTPTGDRIMDFSHAGYRGGGVKIPSVLAKKSVQPSGRDDAAAIQAAIDEVAQLELVDGFCGAVLLEAGRFQCSRTLNLKASGVVLRGSGTATTTIQLTGKPHLAISIAGASSVKASGPATKITDAYVPSGATSFTVASAAALKIGDSIQITRPVTPEWVKFMGMDSLVRDGKQETWVSGEIHCERVVAAITGSRITIDVPLSDSLDARFLGARGATVEKILVSGRISQVGLEGFSIVSPTQNVGISDAHHQALRGRGVSDAWVRDLAIVDTVNSVGFGGDARRITVENVSIRHTLPTVGAAKPADFGADGAQILFNRCSVTGDNVFYFSTGGRVTGPNVVLNCTCTGGGWIQPHMRWATGLLVDGCKVPGGGIDFMNRGEMGSGHGWAIGWAVAWNCSAKRFLIQQPPGAANWAIGCVGQREQQGMPFKHQPNLAEGIFDSPGTPVAPASLYLAQLGERLGAQALKNIGY